MARLALLVVIAIGTSGVAVVSQQTHPTPYPDGKFCTPVGDRIGTKQTKDHPCKCERQDQGYPDQPESKEMCKAGEPVNPSHDPKCLQFCSEDHCACPIACDTAHSGTVKER